jgi:hypothetical protein
LKTNPLSELRVKVLRDDHKGKSEAPTQQTSNHIDEGGFRRKYDEIRSLRRQKKEECPHHEEDARYPPKSLREHNFLLGDPGRYRSPFDLKCISREGSLPRRLAQHRHTKRGCEVLDELAQEDRGSSFTGGEILIDKEDSLPGVHLLERYPIAHNPTMSLPLS